LIQFIQDGDPNGQESRYGVEGSVVWFSIPAESSKEQEGQKAVQGNVQEAMRIPDADLGYNGRIRAEKNAENV
jgi:hypothetical protein